MRIDAPSITGSFVVNNATLPDISGLATVSGNTFTGNQVINGTIVATGTTLVSGSAQVSYTGITNIPSGIVSSSAQTIANLPSGVVSGSVQTIANLPSGVVSGSAQVTTFGFGTTGSNTFQGSQTINGSLVVTGSLTAQQFIVSSSVTYLTTSFASGSTKFGDSADDNHNFTGSVYVNGTLNVNNGTIFTTASSVSIGSTNPTEKLDVYGSIRFRTALQSDSYYTTFAQNAYYTGAWLKYGSGYARTIQLGDGISFKISNAGAGNAGDGITFITPLAITDVGNVGIGGTPSFRLHVSGSSQVTSYFQTSGTYAPITWTGDNGTTKGGVIGHSGNIGIGGLNAGGTGIDGDKSLTIKASSGYVGINTTSVNVPLVISTSGNTLDGTFYSTFTINNTTSTSTSWSRIRFDRSNVAQWGIGEYDGKFRISNLYENGAVAANDSTFVIKNNNYIGISSANPLALLSIGSGSFADTNVVAQLSTGGGGTGAYFGYNKNGTYGLLVGMSNGLDGWTAGIIRQITADPLYFIVNNNTIAMNIQSGGQILIPRQPAFMAYGNGNTTIDASGTYIIYPSVHLNRGSHYNASNGVFTVPVSGVYFFSWTAIGNTTNDVYRWWLRINNVNFLGDAQLRQDTNETGTAYASNGNRQVIANLNAGDTVRIYFVSDAGSQPYGANDAVNAYLNFMGYLIG